MKTKIKYEPICGRVLYELFTSLLLSVSLPESNAKENTKSSQGERERELAFKEKRIGITAE